MWYVLVKSIPLTSLFLSTLQFHLKNKTVRFLNAPCMSMVVGPSIATWGASEDLLKKTESFSPKSRQLQKLFSCGWNFLTTTSLDAGNLSSWHLCMSCLWMKSQLLSLVCAIVLVCTENWSVFSYCLRLLTIFLLHLQRWSLTLGMRNCVINFPFRNKYYIILNLHTLILFFF